MARKRRTQRTAPAEAQAPPPRRPPRAGRLDEIDVIAAVTMLLCLALGYATRNNLNPDGVSYLDLAVAARRGEWSAFIQGYWSPLYPLLLGVLGAVTSMERTAFLPAVHMLNAVIACGGVVVIWRWGHLLRDRLLARLGMATFILAAARPLRIEAVTPDMLLLVLMTWLAYELLAHRGERWIRLGVLMGLMYLAKTSIWPWLLLMIVVRIVAASRNAVRRNVIAGAAVAALVMAPWVGAISNEAGHITLSSAGRLNLCWYLLSCDGRTPDTHIGDHVSYGTAPLATGQSITIATFADQPAWTYLPWSDPTAWEAGVRSQSRRNPSVSHLLTYWGRIAWSATVYWLSPIVLLVLVPVVLVHWRRREGPAPADESRRTMVIGVLGLAGIAQFIAVHAEPRLIAPFVMLSALGFITWMRERGVPDDELSPTRYWVRQGATAAVAIAALALAAGRVPAELEASAQVDQRYLAIEARLRHAHPAGSRRIAVVGYAIPALGDVWRAGARIVAQVPPQDAVAIGQLPSEQQLAEVQRIFRGHADAAWLINPDGRFQWVTIDR